MNMKSLCIGLAFILICLASCSEEHLSDKSLSGEVSLSLSMAPFTKGSTEPLTDKEKQINRCLVSIFKYNNHTVGDLIGKYMEDFSSPVLGSYLVENLVVPMDEQVYILVVANYPESVKDYDSYADFLGLTLGKAIPSYSRPEEFILNEHDLIKVGGAPFTFTATNREAEVNLKQLAAKIRVRLTMEEKVNSVMDAIEIAGVNVVDKINQVIVGGNGNPDVESLFPDHQVKVCKGNSHGFVSSGSHIVNGVDAHSGSKWITMKCDSVKTKKVTTWSVDGLTIKINNIVLNSPLIIENDYAKRVGSLENLEDEKPFVNGTWDYTFYTYQREWLEKSEEKAKGITVEISGTMKDETVTYKQSRSGTLHAGWSGPNGIEEQKGWGGGTHFVAADGNDFGDTPWSVFKLDGDPVQGTLSTSQIFRAVINPSQSSSSTAGLLQGNYYDVTGTLKIDPKAEAEITWVVVDIDNVQVDVPSFD